ncbi:Aldo/keto reductase [Rhizophagus irregularis]|uniref:Aldo/keto reductase n=1 Tax=Rhizophagus irregularis TaxID=588596 RepID=A0A2I1HBN9_9GLOM|nr:Aldo/keto reductase [Rhizophagus irregularis]
MLFRELSKTGVKIPAIGMGTYTYGSADEQENIKALNRAFDLGCTFWDSADIYDNGANEILLSKVLKDRRNEVFLCTKFGIVRAQGDNMIVIPGTRKIKHLEENVEAVKVNLSSEELAEIRQIINSIEIIGNRYNDYFMKRMMDYFWPTCRLKVVKRRFFFCKYDFAPNIKEFSIYHHRNLFMILCSDGQRFSR